MQEQHRSNQPSRRCALAAVPAFCLLTMLRTADAADAWPRQPLKVIVPGPAGSSPDVVMRIIGERMAGTLGQPVIVENRPGAGGTVAIQALKNARDGHTIFFSLTGVAVLTPLLIKAARFDVQRDLVPVASMADMPLMMVRKPGGPARVLADVLKEAQQKPNSVTIATPGPGTLGHLTALSLAQQSGARISIVPFSQPGAALSAIVNGDAQYYVDGVSVMLPFLRAGKLAAVALLSGGPLQGLEAYPLGKDSVAGIEVMGRLGLMATRDLPAGAAELIASALAKALAEPDVQARLREFGAYPRAGNGALYASILQQEKALWGGVAQKAGIEPQ